MLKDIQSLRKQLHERLNTDFPFYAKYNLKIRTESGSIAPFILNDAQRALNAFAEKQLAETGRVRILIPKARQEGCSTYIGGRFYHHTTRFKGKATFILSHQAETTEKLFQIIERFQKHCPEPVKANTDVANRRRLVFSGIDSEYFVGTAGNEEIGRGGTLQYLHASEAAYYPDGQGFTKGILQSVPDLPGTEVFIESTANGLDPLFYRMCMDALSGASEYRVFFIPWFWKYTYRKIVPADFEITEDEAKLKELYKLDNEQVYWRRRKIADDFRGSLKDFQQEYPACVEEAFISSGESLISSFKVMEARKSVIEDKGAPLVMGVDPNEAGGRTGIAFRRGRHLEKVQEESRQKPMELVGVIAELIDNWQPVKCFIDTGNGYGIVDRLLELGYGDIVQGVSFNDGATDDAVFLNKRVEMYYSLKDWLEQGGVRIPDSDVLHKEICCIPVAKRTSSGLKKLEPKEKIIEDFKIRPDLADACVLTFAYPVRVEGWHKARKPQIVNKSQSKIKSIQRRNTIGRAGGSVAIAMAAV